MNRRLDAGPLIALLGALLLLVSLFLAWYEPSTEVWDAFEITDLLLAGIAIAALLAAASLIADVPGRIDSRWLPWLAAAALVLVVAALVNPPPGIEADPTTGLWLALAGAALLSAGAILVVASVSISLDVAPRERRQRVPAVDARPSAAPGESVRVSQTEKTEPLPPESPAT
jgi:peptidoglycan/LPS O-acetylase OafA/YrhL